MLKIGIDIGSTTIKGVVIDQECHILFSEYVRHNTLIKETLISLLTKIEDHFQNRPFQIAFTGSAGMGIAEKSNSLFVQEIIAASYLLKAQYPSVNTLLDIGGEDAKLVLFDHASNPDFRMNGNCAGGTGAYIDQMAALLHVSIDQLNQLASKSTKKYPIASRCGVFAKTDVQNLISRKIETEDIASSIFEAVANQTVNALAKGSIIQPQILMCGGPLTFIPELRSAFVQVLKISHQDIIIPNHGELFTAIGTAFSIPDSHNEIQLNQLISSISSQIPSENPHNNLFPLFENIETFNHWNCHKNLVQLPSNLISKAKELYIGIDSGSTTTKIVALNENQELVYDFYAHNNGDQLKSVITGLTEMKEKFDHHSIPVISTAVTGYGEDLIHKGLGIDFGIVETVAHSIAAHQMEPEVSFILDIGGQDMKAIFLQNGVISNIEINEACSSGCGTFIEGFANTLGYSAAQFAEIAITSTTPYDLGSRCTVFMNSKVKQALRDGATVSDLSAGLAYSVIKNCLNKVMRLQTYDSLGNSIVVQGGTFKNNAVLRSLEILTGKKVFISDHPELMGAYGSAIYAYRNREKLEKSSFIGFRNITDNQLLQNDFLTCKGCTNHCVITEYHFLNGAVCFAGNKCEKIYSNNSIKHAKGENVFEQKWKLYKLEEHKTPIKSPIRIGLPLILNMYENFHFWSTLFTECDLEVVPSDESTQKLYKKGIGGVMSDNICFPAKVSHGHIVNLMEKKVDRIFLPIVVYEKKRFKNTTNSFNCPVVTGYPEILKSSAIQNPDDITQIDSIPINFNNQKLLKKSCKSYLKSLGIKENRIHQAFEKALNAQEKFKNDLLTCNKEVLLEAQKQHKPIVMVAGHPYHSDPLIHQKVSNILSDLGAFVINEEIAQDYTHEGFDSFFTISQWEYTNRILHAVKWVSEQSIPIAIVQLNSFGCGLDSIILGEIKELVNQKQIPYAWVRIDEISSPGSIKLRLRSLVESMKMRAVEFNYTDLEFQKPQLAIFEKGDTHKTILFPWFSDFYSPLAPTLAQQIGYHFENLPPSDQTSIDLGLKYANNEICYPATLVVGDIIKGLQSGRYDLNKVAIGITQTGGQCRATNYLSLIKRAISNAGYENVPVIGLGSPDAIFNMQPGFQPDWMKIIIPTFYALLFADAVSQMYYATASREEANTESKRLKTKYIDLANQSIQNKQHKTLIPLLQEAVHEFNQIPVKYEEVKTVGIVGEIYVKYNAYGQYNIVEWLIENHVEVVVPPMLEFMMQAFVNSKVQKETFIAPNKLFDFSGTVVEQFANRYIRKFDKVMQDFRYYRPNHTIHESASMAAEILDLNHQYGEGWLIPAEIAAFAHQNINNVICLQPFGCIANHIIGKGMEKKIKDKYQDINLLYLDFDSGISKVNVLNRIYFLLQK
jgi:predicted CoA-substrate-specific enzyme activase